MASDSESKPSSIEIPAPEESDSAQVVSCLELAGELWKSGQHKEAIRFIQRGAAAAEEDGNDMRALKLARLGADLSAQVADGAPAAAAPAASGSNGAAAKSSAAAVSAPSAPSPRPHPADHPSVRVSQPPPLPAGSVAGQSTPSPPSVGPSTPSAATDDEKAAAADQAKGRDEDKDSDKQKDKDAVAAAPSASKSSSSSVGPASARGSRASAAERASVKPSASRSGALVASAPPKPSAPPTPNAPTSRSVAELIASGLAERVSVKRSSLDASLLVVRPMTGNGAKPAHGARTAVLIYVDSDVEA